eukprot:jgi/Mesvir1/27046/Mv20742-RA.1
MNMFQPCVTVVRPVLSGSCKSDVHHGGFQRINTFPSIQRLGLVFSLPNYKALAGKSKTIQCAAANEAKTRLVTFLGKGGAGKTTAAIALAKRYAEMGKNTCLVVQGADRSEDALLGMAIPHKPAPVDGVKNLEAMRLESTKLLVDPWNTLRKADSEMGFSGGVINKVVGEELAVLPGMDAILAVGQLESMTGAAGGSEATGAVWDVVVYDGPSSTEVLRLFGAPERMKWYLDRLRGLADKTEAGRLFLPSLVTMVDTYFGNQISGDKVNGAMQRASDAFSNPSKFTCFLVADGSCRPSIESAHRMWGCAMQAGMHVGGLFVSRVPSASAAEQIKSVTTEFDPLVVVQLPQVGPGGGMEAWAPLMKSFPSDLDARTCNPAMPRPYVIDEAASTVELFLPGFDKKEVKLSQWRDNMELLVDVGEQRRNILLPAGMRGKVKGAKFTNNKLVVTVGRG